jgi:hypothetical protein
LAEQNVAGGRFVRGFMVSILEQRFKVERKDLVIQREIYLVFPMSRMCKSVIQNVDRAWVSFWNSWTVATTIKSSDLEITLKYDKSCRKLSDLLSRLQPLLQHIESQAPKLSSNVSLVHTWLTELEKRLKAAETTLNVSNEQHPRLTAPVSRYRAANEIKELTESVEELLQQDLR